MARGIEKSFLSGGGAVPVLRGVDLSIDAGETFAVTGESGSGKSTLLHILGALEIPDAGTVAVDGMNVSDLSDARRAEVRRGRIGLVFQQFNLVPSLTVEANLDLQARLAGRFDSAWTARLAERLGLDPLLRRYPEELSGGQQQRVAIGRAVAHRPGLILADEPTGNLDEATGDAALDLLLDLVSETRAALLTATHSERLASRMGRRLRLSGGTLE